MKSYIKKRKHRNGVRPERKGTLKVRMINLPSHSDQCMGAVRACIRMNNASLQADRLKDREQAWEHVGRFIMAANMMNKGTDFLNGYRQIGTVDVALAAINEVSPDYEKPMKMPDVCGNCEDNNNCRFRAFSGDKKIIRCIRLFVAWSKSFKDGDELLTTADMAKLALQHLS